MRPQIAVIVAFLLAVYPAGCGTTRVARAPAASRAPAPVEMPIQSKPREATDQERERYAEREMQSSGLEKFRGGDGVVTVLLVVVLVIVILILLKKI
jgi:hypothetical protein